MRNETNWRGDFLRIYRALDEGQQKHIQRGPVSLHVGNRDLSASECEERHLNKLNHD